MRRLEGARWKKALDVQAPYRWNLRRLDLGRTLDVGCGIGRNLLNLPAGSLGVDHNEDSVATARERGLDAVSSREFPARVAAEEPFDAMLLAHVLEHMPEDDADAVVAQYLPHVRPGGKVVFICPQERGQASDPTHVRFVDAPGLRRHAVRHGLQVLRTWSFPFPRPVGRVFTYNESVLLARLPGERP